MIPTRPNLSKWALEHQVLVLYFMVALAIAGALSYLRLGQAEDPAFTFKIMVVRTFWPGATAREVEQEVTERLEKKLEQYSGQLMRASVELAKDWRTDKYLRNLEALMIVADKDTLLVLTGNGDVLEPVGEIAAIGSGGNFALAAARALADYESDAETIARKAMAVAAEICVFTNGNLTVETV